jgi:hypothetical protein
MVYTNLFHSKALQNFPKFGFLVGKNTIWQPCSATKLFKTFQGDYQNEKKSFARKNL